MRCGSWNRKEKKIAECVRNQPRPNSLAIFAGDRVCRDRRLKSLHVSPALDIHACVASPLLSLVE